MDWPHWPRFTDTYAYNTGSKKCLTIDRLGAKNIFRPQLLACRKFGVCSTSAIRNIF